MVPSHSPPTVRSAEAFIKGRANSLCKLFSFSKHSQSSSLTNSRVPYFRNVSKWWSSRSVGTPYITTNAGEGDLIGSGFHLPIFGTTNASWGRYSMVPGAINTFHPFISVRPILLTTRLAVVSKPGTFAKHDYKLRLNTYIEMGC